MLGGRWITDRIATERFPDYTRANAGEVLPDPVTPLGWTFCWESGVVLGCRDGFVSFGVFDADEYGDPPETFGLFGGYFYNSLTQARLVGVRMPGASPEQIDQAYFDEHPDVPAYVARDWHESERHSAKLAETQAYVLSTDHHAPVDEQKAVAERIRAERPDLDSLDDDALVDRARSLQPQMVANFEQHVWVSLAATFGPGILTAICAGLGRPDDAIRLITAVGGVDSADIARDLWALSRTVRRSPRLSALFDAGPEGRSDRIAESELAGPFERFLYVHGSRGPNEWDPGADTYETRPDLALVQLDLMRRQGDEADPAAALDRNRVERERLRAEIGALLAGREEAALLDVGIGSAAVWMAARERCKNNNVRVIHEARLCFDELGRRMTGAGHLAHPKQIYMLMESELDRYLAAPASFTATLAEREVDHRRLHDLEPPFIVNGTVAALSTWPERRRAAVATAGRGEVLTGVACSPGRVTGVAKVVLDAADPGALQPGDVLVTAQTDPSWTPLFLVAGAVVTNVGAVGSHASIVSRELGIACVASVADATRRIPHGAKVSVDGAAGTVTIEALP